ncbi:hypothetical protein MKW98_015857, partial [Papaver atlanticum]
QGQGLNHLHQQNRYTAENVGLFWFYLHHRNNHYGAVPRKYDQVLTGPYLQRALNNQGRDAFSLRGHHYLLNP